MRAKDMLPKDAGAALITVLVLVAVMATLAIVVVDAARFSVQRTSNQRAIEQARLYLYGAESYARGRLRQLQRAQQEEGARIDQTEWQGRPLTYPLDEGLMTVRLYDAGNCFNLNSIVESAEGGLLFASSRGQVQLARLLDLSEARSGNGFALVTALADYVDTDRAPLNGSVEDAPRNGGEGPFRAANTLMGDVGELLNVRGFTPEIVRKLAPLVCARPTPAVNVLNVNTLRVDQAALLAAAMGTAATVNDARALLDSRPRGGWQDVEAFLQSAQFSGVEMSEEYRAQFTTTARAYVLVAEVRYRDVDEASAVLMEAGPPVRVLRRVFGPAVTERSV
jgi:general secretion pathway protein K